MMSERRGSLGPSSPVGLHGCHRDPPRPVWIKIRTICHTPPRRAEQLPNRPRPLRLRKPSSTLQLISKKPSPDHLSDKRGIFQGRHLLPPPHPAKSVVSLTQAASIEAAFSRSSSINSAEIWHKTRSGCGEDDEISADSDSHIIRAPQVEALRLLVRKLPPYWGPYYPYWVEYWGPYKTFCSPPHPLR